MAELEIPQEGQQIVLILVGVVGSGKSTFAEALEQHFPQFRRCNQDDLGNRQRVEALARSTLRQGFSVCIDRTNIDETQRAHWINIAREFPGAAIWVIHFDTPYEICAARLRERTSHPTIKTPQLGLQVLARFSSDFVAPSFDEGFDHLLTLYPSDHDSPIYTRSDVYDILKRVRDSPTLESRNIRGYPFSGSRTHRARGRSRGYFTSRTRTGRGSTLRGWTTQESPEAGRRGREKRTQ